MLFGSKFLPGTSSKRSANVGRLFACARYGTAMATFIAVLGPGASRDNGNFATKSHICGKMTRTPRVVTAASRRWRSCVSRRVMSATGMHARCNHQRFVCSLRPLIFVLSGRSLSSLCVPSLEIDTVPHRRSCPPCSKAGRTKRNRSEPTTS